MFYRLINYAEKQVHPLTGWWTTDPSEIISQVEDEYALAWETEGAHGLWPHELLVLEAEGDSNPSGAPCPPREVEGTRAYLLRPRNVRVRGHDEWLRAHGVTRIGPCRTEL